MTEILTPVSTDHSPVLFSFSKEKFTITDKGIWNFNSSFTKDQNYIIEIKKVIHNFSNENESLLNCQLKWEFLKYEVKKLSTRNMLQKKNGNREQI